MIKKSIKTIVKTESELDVKEMITRRIEKAIQEEINKCSQEYYRNVEVNIELVIE